MILLSLIWINQSQAQNFYVGLYGGYAFPFISQRAGSNSAETERDYSMGTSATTGSYKLESVYANFGSGMNAGLKAGFVWKSGIGFELGYAQFFTPECKYTYDDKYYFDDVLQHSGYGEYIYHTKLSTLSTGVVYTMPTSKFAPYVRAGLLVGFSKMSIDLNSSYYNVNSSSNKYEMSIDYTGKPGIGGYASIGLKYKIAPALSMYAEVNMNAITFTPQKGEVTKYMQNGVDLLPQRTTSEKEVEFVDEISETYPYTPNDNEPNQSLKQRYSFSSMGINVGLVYVFNSIE